MPEEVILRGALVLILIGSGVGFYLLVNRVLLLRARLLNSTPEGWPSSSQGKGKPVILYFTMPNCIPCRTIQRPVIERVQVQHGESLEVVEIDASVQTDLAGRWGVMSVPTTFVLDPEGKPRYVNHGVTTAEKLANQVGALLK